MDGNYKCCIDIRLSGGDIQFDVSDDMQLFRFQSGIGFVAIPHFFITLSALYKGEISEAQLDCHGNADYYLFSSDGQNLFIEHVGHYPQRTDTYQFKLKAYMEAISCAFLSYLQQLEKEGILPLKEQEFGHPLGDDVLHAFDNFSAVLSS